MCEVVPAGRRFLPILLNRPFGVATTTAQKDSLAMPTTRRYVILRPSVAVAVVDPGFAWV